jgi:hypothetical protein
MMMMNEMNDKDNNKDKKNELNIENEKKVIGLKRSLEERIMNEYADDILIEKKKSKVEKEGKREEEDMEKEKEVIVDEKKKVLKKMPRNAAITLTMGDRAENHRGMEIIGNAADRGFSYDELKKVLDYFKKELKVKKGCILSIHELLKSNHPDVTTLPEAYILIIPNGIKRCSRYKAEPINNKLMNCNQPIICIS